MPRPRKGRRCLGPYGRGPYAVAIFDGEGGRDDREFATQEEASAHIRLVEQAWGQLDERSIADALDSYDDHLKGSNNDGSRKERMRRLRLFFSSAASMRLTRLHHTRAKELYAAFRVGRSVDYHRNTLGGARGFLEWCRKEGWVASNALTDVDGVGERTAGKEQHTGDEAQRFFRWCMWKAHRRGDGHQRRDSDAAIGVMLALTLGLRSGDVTKRLVRDVDLDGTVLRVGMTTDRKRQGKTARSNRARRVPELLQPLLRQVVTGRGPLEPLFAAMDGGHHTRAWLLAAMKRFCRDADVPYVCVHALKGTAGNVLADEGDAADRIAAHLSHESSMTTTRHYVDGEAVEAARRGRGFAVIAGGKK